MYRYLLNIIISLVVLVFSIIRADSAGSIVYVIMALSVVSLVANLVMLIKKRKQS